MQSYSPVPYQQRLIRVDAIRGEKLRLATDWRGVGTVSASVWRTKGLITALSESALDSSSASVLLEATGAGLEAFENAVTLSTGESSVQQYEINIRPSLPEATSCPVLLTPANGGDVEDTDRATVTWGRSVYATEYKVYFQGSLVATVSDTSYEFTGLDPDHTYSWSVVPVDADGNGPVSCGSYTFTTAVLQCPGLQIPTNGASVGEETSTTLLWTAVDGASSYNVYVWENGDPQPGTPTTNTALLTYEVTGLSSGTTYRWTVDAVSPNGFVSPGCNSQTFETAPAPAVIEFLSSTFSLDIQASEVSITAIRSGNTTISASADYDFTEGTALIGPDFIATPGTVTFAPGEVTKDIVVPLVRDYDAEVLADNPSAYWKFNDADDNSGIFQDRTANDWDVTATTGEALISYQQPSLNLSTSLSAHHVPAGGDFHLSRSYGTYIPGTRNISMTGWGKFDVSDDVVDRVLFHVGGSGGGANQTKFQFYRVAGSGVLRVFWQTNVAANVFKTFSMASPAFGEEFWFSISQDCTNRLVRLSINDSAEETLSWTSPEDPYQIPEPDRVTRISPCSSFNTSWRDKCVGGAFAEFEYYDSVVTIKKRWTRWNLDASLTFMSALSNPSVGAELGAIDETTVTLEAQ